MSRVVGGAVDLIGVFIILWAVILLFINVIGGLLTLGAGLLALSVVRKKLKINGKKAFGVGLVMYLFGFMFALASTQNTETPSTTQTIAEKTTEVAKAEQLKPITPPAETAPQPAVVPMVEKTDNIVVEQSPSTQYDVLCKIVAIADGDTATCLTDDKTQIKIRFDQIDAPEQGQDFGNTAKQTLSKLIFGKMVGLKTKEQDKYGRTVAEVFVDDKNINKEMVALGMAWAYREYLKDNEYLELETTARRKSLGLWSQPNAIYPSDFRRGKRGEQSTPKQTQQITQTQEQRDLADSGGQCGSKRTCKAMSSCAEAKHYLNVCGVSRLDKDGDGVPCESLCR